MMMMMMIIMMMTLKPNIMQVSKLGLAVNSLVFGGFQPVDVLADIRLAESYGFVSMIVDIIVMSIMCNIYVNTFFAIINIIALNFKGSSKTREGEGTLTFGGFMTMEGCLPCWLIFFKAGPSNNNDGDDEDDDGDHPCHHQAAVLGVHLESVHHGERQAEQQHEHVRDVQQDHRGEDGVSEDDHDNRFICLPVDNYPDTNYNPDNNSYQKYGEQEFFQIKYQRSGFE